MAAQRDLTQKNRRHGHLAECKSLREERPRVGMRASGEDYRLSSARANTLSRICRSLRAQFVFARRRHISLTSGRLAKEADARNKALVSATYTETPPFDSRGWGCGRGQRGCGGVCGGGQSQPHLWPRCSGVSDAQIKTFPPLSPQAGAAASESGAPPGDASVLCLLLQRIPQKINASDS